MLSRFFLILRVAALQTRLCTLGVGQHVGLARLRQGREGGVGGAGSGRSSGGSGRVCSWDGCGMSENS